MFYQTGDGVFLTKWKYSFDNGEVLYGEFSEKELEEYIENHNEYNPESTISEYEKEEVKLEKEEQQKFDIIKEVKDITLDEVRNFVLNDVEPTNLHWENSKLKLENAELKGEVEALQQEQMMIMMGLAEIGELVTNKVE